ncbi:MAG TPA: thioredoxin family protein [Streptosporangiaceae bacterium]|nr:thioredoxin family protein [Streptosporangiaceae bacterium]
MELTILTVPGCPNAAALEERLAAVLADYPGSVVRRRQVANEQEAAEAGMAGSPTLLIDGTDPFAVPGQMAALSCRLYRNEAGRLAGAPSAEDLRRALEQASADDRHVP